MVGKPHRNRLCHLLLLMRAINSLQPRDSAPGKNLGHWLAAEDRHAVKHACLNIRHALAGGSVPPECCAAIAAEVAYHGVA